MDVQVREMLEAGVESGERSRQGGAEKLAQCATRAGRIGFARELPAQEVLPGDVGGTPQGALEVGQRRVAHSLGVNEMFPDAEQYQGAWRWQVIEQGAGQ